MQIPKKSIAQLLLQFESDRGILQTDLFSFQLHPAAERAHQSTPQKVGMNRREWEAEQRAIPEQLKTEARHLMQQWISLRTGRSLSQVRRIEKRIIAKQRRVGLLLEPMGMNEKAFAS